MRDWKNHVRTNLPALGVRAEREAEIVEELAGQLESAYNDALAAGLTEDDAGRRAEDEIGDWKQLARSIREVERREPARVVLGDATAARFGAGLTGDLKYAVRMLRKSPGFAATAVLTLALGIGGCVAIYSLLNAVVLRPLEYRDPDRLVMVWERNYPRDRRTNVISPANYLDWKARNRVFDSMSVVLIWTINLTGSGEPEQVRTHLVEPEFMSILGVQPLIGRPLTNADAAPNAPRVALLGHRFWMRKFNGSSGIVGQAVTLSGTPTTIVGVLPAGFRSIGPEPEVLVPYAPDPAVDYRRRAGRYMSAIARLRAGVTVAQAEREMNAIARDLEREHPDFNKGWGVTIEPLQSHFAGKARAGLWTLTAAVALVLLIACSNIAGLLLVRASVREREIAIRSALGARSGRIVRQLLSESLVLAGLGGLLGCAAAFWLLRALKAIAPVEVPRLESASIDLDALAIALLLTVITGLLAGVAPALAAARTDLVRGLKEGSRGSGGLRGRKLRSFFVAAQVALSCVLLVGCALLVRSFSKMLSTNPGFATESVLTMRLSLDALRDGDRETMPRLFNDLVEGALTLPGVESASAVTFLPFTGPGAATSYHVPGRPEAVGGERPVTEVRMIEPHFFETMQIPLMEGRVFTAVDNRPDAPLRFVVSETMAREAYPGRSAIGRPLSVSMGEGNRDGEIIGVVGDIRVSSLSGAVRPMVYYPLARLQFGFASLVIRTSGDPALLARPMLRLIRGKYPDQPVSDVRPMRDWVSRSLLQQRFLALIVSGLAGLSLLLTAVGLYGMLSYTVAQRTRDIGLRLALGAHPGRVRGEVLWQGVKFAGLGLIAGATSAAAITPLLKPVLEDVRPADPSSYAAALAVLACAALLAACIPAHRATKVDPAVTLRDE